ncbi:hypothetical protein D3C76_1588040 [compost metagenome]
MSRTILHMSNQRLRFSELRQNRPYDMQIRPFIISTNIVNFAIPSLMNNEINCTAVILNVQPVTNI